MRRLFNPKFRDGLDLRGRRVGPVITPTVTPFIAMPRWREGAGRSIGLALATLVAILGTLLLIMWAPEAWADDIEARTVVVVTKVAEQALETAEPPPSPGRPAPA